MPIPSARPRCYVGPLARRLYVGPARPAPARSPASCSCSGPCHCRPRWCGPCDAPGLRVFKEGPARDRIRGCEVFQAGIHRGKSYSIRDLDDMVENFKRFSTMNPQTRRIALEVPAVLGHEEDQEFLERSDLPAAAWCERLYREGSKLKADFRDVPPSVVRLLDGRRYKKVSAEVYDEPPEGIPGRGKMLRRVAFLGGDIPQLKSLSDIPLPEAAPARTRRAVARLAG